MGLQQVHPQSYPAHLRLYLGSSKVPRSGQVESALHRAKGLFHLEANAADLGVEGFEQGMHRMAFAGLVLDRSPMP